MAEDPGCEIARTPSEPGLMPADTFADEAAAAAAGSAAVELPPAAAPAIVRNLAATIAGFCNDSAVADSEGWRVRIPLRADVLPETTLELSISAHWLCLRFEIGDETARHLVFTHSQTLVSMLETSLHRRREVSLSFD